MLALSCVGQGIILTSYVSLKAAGVKNNLILHENQTKLQGLCFIWGQVFIASEFPYDLLCCTIFVLWIIQISMLAIHVFLKLNGANFLIVFAVILISQMCFPNYNFQNSDSPSPWDIDVSVYGMFAQ